MLSRVGALALLGTVGLAAFFGPSWVTSAPAELRISILATSAAYFIAGQVARHRRPRSRIGPVLVATGLAFMMSVFQG
jgi:hypothetical protein